MPPSAEALRIWAPALTGRFHRKSAKIGGTGAWSRGAQMRDGSNFAAFHASQSGGALPPSAEALRIWAPALTGRFRRKSTKFGGTGAWIAGAQMPGGSIFGMSTHATIYNVNACNYLCIYLFIFYVKGITNVSPPLGFVLSLLNFGTKKNI